MVRFVLPAGAYCLTGRARADSREDFLCSFVVFEKLDKNKLDFYKALLYSNIAVVDVRNIACNDTHYFGRVIYVRNRKSCA